MRCRPDLAAGRYKVSLRPETPFREDADFSVRVHSSLSEARVAIKPLESLAVGTFDFCEGTNSVVEILAKDSTGLVVSDAVEFTKAPE